MAHTPVSIVIFGVTGDLARGKIIPAIFDLYRHGDIGEDFSVIGYGRKVLCAEEFSSLINDAIALKYPDKNPKSLRQARRFIDKCTYVQGELAEKKGYDLLKEATKGSGRNIFFLSVHPELHSTIISQLGKEKLLNKESQIMIEKPFGHDAVSAASLDALLRRYIQENQIYRVDHYLGKSALIDVIERRRNDPDFERALGYIKEIKVSLWETKTVARRGAFYDIVGALKDVGQNHLLQMLAVILSSKSVLSPDATKVQKARAGAISSLRIKTPVMRGQYVKYHDEPGVNPYSETETFFSINASTVLARHRKANIYLSAGKALSESRADIYIKFSKPVKLKEGVIKEMIFTINTPLGLSNSAGRNREAYEMIFLAVLKKDQKLFCSLDEAIAGWKFDERVRGFWKQHETPLQRYEVGGTIHISKKLDSVI